MKYLKTFSKRVLSQAHLFTHNEFKEQFDTLNVPKGILLADDTQVETYLSRIYKTTNLKQTPITNEELVTICMELGRLGYALHGNINLYKLGDYNHIHLIKPHSKDVITVLYGQVFKVPNDQANDVKTIINKTMNGKLGWGFEWSSVKEANQ